MIYHITNREAWERAGAAGCYRAASLEAEGFIHCSLRGQVVAVANAFYAGETGLLLLCIDERRLAAQLRWEAPSHPNPGMDNVPAEDAAFPHIYGPLNLEAVAAVHELPPGADGFALPPGLPG